MMGLEVPLAGVGTALKGLTRLSLFKFWRLKACHTGQMGVGLGPTP